MQPQTLNHLAPNGKQLPFGMYPIQTAMFVPYWGPTLESLRFYDPSLLHEPKFVYQCVLLVGILEIGIIKWHQSFNFLAIKGTVGFGFDTSPSRIVDLLSADRCSRNVNPQTIFFFFFGRSWFYIKLPLPLPPPPTSSPRTNPGGISNSPCSFLCKFKPESLGSLSVAACWINPWLKW